MTTVLSYHDVCLKKSDVACLKDQNWLNDQIIDFFFEYLSHEVYQDCNDILFVGPNTVQLAKFCNSEELAPLIEQLNVSRTNLVLFPINDNTEADSAGGSHWSILVFNRNWDPPFAHYDSCGDHNLVVARGVAAVFLPLLDASCSINSLAYEQKLNVVRGCCQQQENGWDCGVFVIINAELIAEAYKNQTSCLNLNSTDKNIAVKKRIELTELIKTLAKRTTSESQL